MNTNHPYFHHFKTDIRHIPIPDILGYPHNYQPHELAIIAAEELQNYLNSQLDWEHDFGFDPTDETIGKMFGTLVVKNKQGELGYLCAVSGRLAGTNQHSRFVPPVFDILIEQGFFKKGEAIITEINDQVQKIENGSGFLTAKKKLEEALFHSQRELSDYKSLLKDRKEKRDQLRSDLKVTLHETEINKEWKKLDEESVSDHYNFKKLKQEWKNTISLLESQLLEYQNEITDLKEERKQRSAALQNEIFDQFYFVNKALERKSIGDIFKDTKEGRPKAGAGECAAPKLFQYAFLNDYVPVALAEFWWGKSPKTEIRIHKQFYPACRGKCEPILLHMLKGLNVETNPLANLSYSNDSLEIVWEDDAIIIVNKPCELLSVPGRRIDDSILTRLKKLYPSLDGPVIVHRLDMSTSGLLISAKNLEAYKDLQKQFTDRVIKKRYVAVLDGTIESDEGVIELPIRVDLDDRPRQMVCYEHGKSAKTIWKVIERKNGKTLIHFFPITGRTHQLRVHAAHPDGLNCPILGDDLYGKKADRLYLHAEQLEFEHPITKERKTIYLPANFKI